MGFNVQDVEIRKTSLITRKGERNPMAPKMYISIKRESLVENLLNRRNRPYSEYKKHIIPKVMEVIQTQDPALYDKLKDSKWSWDKNNGCSMCPCSPGFVVKGINETVDIFVDI